MWEGGGTVPPELGLGKQLVARGHRVDVLGDPTIEREAVRAGFRFHPWREAPSCAARTPEAALVRDWEQKSILESIRTYLDGFLCGPAPRYARDTLRTLDETGADVVLTDAVLFGPSMAAAVRGLPRIALMPNIYILPARGLPPMGPGFMPARGPLGRLRDWALRTIMTRAFNSGTPLLNRARAELGLQPLGGVIDQFLDVDQFLLLTSQDFDFPGELPPHVRYAGPVLDDPSWCDAGGAWELPWPSDVDGPIVLVGLSSTFQDQAPLIRRIIAALSTLPVRGLVTLGEQMDHERFESTKNVVVTRSAPHGVVLRQAAAVITHCGHGTAIKAMCAGVPVVCIPMGRDQNDTAARIVARDAGLRLTPKARAPAIALALSRVLKEPGFRLGARALGAKIEAGLTARSPADVLLDGVGAEPPPGRWERRQRAVEALA
jgi:UDP:flavonoid glycosyltransferase YjiC (YdhE family)